MKVHEKELAMYIAHYKQTAAARKKVWELKHVQNRIQRPSMRQKASLQQQHPPDSSSHMHRDDDTESMVSYMSSAASTFQCAAVSAMSFEQHCSLIRYPNSMSNLRRLRCYLLACQGHNFQYAEHLEALVPADVAKALAQNPVVFPEMKSVYIGIDSLALNMLPFQVLTACHHLVFEARLLTFSHRKAGAQPLPDKMLLQLRIASEAESVPHRGSQALRGGLPDQDHVEAALDHHLPCHVAANHSRRGDLCCFHSFCCQTLCGNSQDKPAFSMQPLILTPFFKM